MSRTTKWSKLMNARKLILIPALLLVVVGCKTDADIASENVSKAADQFTVARRVVFYNGITGTYMLNVTYFVEQLDPAQVSVDHYKVIFKPEIIIPDIELK